MSFPRQVVSAGCTSWSVTGSGEGLPAPPSAMAPATEAPAAEAPAADAPRAVAPRAIAPRAIAPRAIAPRAIRAVEISAGVEPRPPIGAVVGPIAVGGPVAVVVGAIGLAVGRVGVTVVARAPSKGRRGRTVECDQRRGHRQRKKQSTHSSLLPVAFQER